MTEMVERVARAMWEQTALGSEQFWLKQARFAIEAMSEPTDAMAQVGGRIIAGLSSGRAITPYEDDAAEAWRVMIAAALSHSTHTPIQEQGA